VSGGDIGGPRKLGLPMATALVVGSMVGSGVFLLPAQLAPFGWNSVVAWAVTITGAMMLAVVISRLTRAFPTAQGPIGIVGDTLGPFIATLIGWSTWVSYWTAVATLAIAATSYLSVFFPSLATSRTLAAAANIGLIGVITVLNLRGARAAGGFQLITTILKLMPLIAVIIILAALGAKGTMPVAPFPTEGLSLPAITTAASLTLWALVGFEACGLAGDKIERPEINVGRATVIGTALTGIIYIIVCSGILLTLPQATLAASNAPFALFIESYWSRDAALAVAAFAAISAIGAMNGFVLIQGEIPLTMARRGLLPAWFGKTNALGTPIRMIIISSLFACALVLFNSSKSLGSLFAFMALLSTSATLWLYLALAMTALRRNIAVALALLGGIYALWTLLGAGIDASGLSLILMLTALPIYLWMRRNSIRPGPSS
jgi:basic amino acid/polyamine antiporter, APA family